jgi:hypothetical protein
MELYDPIGVPTSPSPSSWIATNYKLMIAQGEGRSPMTSPDAEMDFKPIIIIIKPRRGCGYQYSAPRN